MKTTVVLIKNSFDTKLSNKSKNRYKSTRSQKSIVDAVCHMEPLPHNKKSLIKKLSINTQRYEVQNKVEIVENEFNP